MKPTNTNAIKSKEDLQKFTDAVKNTGNSSLCTIFETCMDKAMTISAAERSIGTNLMTAAVERRFQKIADEGNMDYKIGNHTFRKTFGYHYLNDGGDINELMKMYGYNSAELLKRYIYGDEYAE